MNIKVKIKERGWTIERVAKEMGITRITLSQNISRNPTVKTLQRIADIIGCKVGDFFMDEIDTNKTTIVCPKCGESINVSVKIEV